MNGHFSASWLYALSANFATARGFGSVQSEARPELDRSEAKTKAEPCLTLVIVRLHEALNSCCTSVYSADPGLKVNALVELEVMASQDSGWSEDKHTSLIKHFTKI